MKKITHWNLFSRLLKFNAFFIMMLCVSLSFHKVAAQTVQIGTGTGTTTTASTTVPITNYNFSYCQMIVTAAQITAGGGVAGEISKLRFYTTSIGTTSVWANNWVVYLGNTTKTSFSSNTDWIPQAEMQAVYTGAVTPIANGWWEINLATPFNYTGTNVVVAIDENTPGWSSTPTFRTFTSGSNTGICFRTDGAAQNPNPATPPTATGRTSSLPQIQLYFTEPCAYPTGLTATGLTHNSATLSWVSAASLFDVNWGTGTFTAGNGANTNVGVSNNYSLGTTLTPNTVYTYYVRANCGAVGISSWAGPFSFRTACTAVTTFPWSENFNAITTPNLPDCWIQLDINNDSDVWQTYPSYGVTDSKSVGLYTDGNNGNNNDYLVLPPFLLTGNQRMKFSVRARSTSEPNDYRVVLSTTGNSPADFTNVLMPLTTVSNTTHQEVNWIDLSSYTGNAYIAIHVPQGGLDGYYIYFDDFLIQDIPSCLIPENVQVNTVTKNSATILWTAPSIAPANGYIYEIRTSGDAGSGATGLVQTNTTAAGVTTANATSLTPSTSYSVYVRSVCAAGNLSAWTLVKTFKTLCDYPDLVSTTPATICGVGTANLSSNFSNNTNVNWYAAATGGSSLHTGVDFTTPELDATTSFWVSATGSSINLSGGKTTHGTSGTTPSTYGLVFDANQEFVLNSVDVYLASTTAGNVLIRLTNSAGTMLQEATVAVPAGGSQTAPVQHTIPLNFTIPAGTGHRLLAISGPSMIRDFSPNSFPFTIGDVASITSGYISGTSQSYYYFYNWQITAACNSPRTEVVVTVTPAPELTLSTDEVDVCQGNNSETITVITGASNYDTYTWLPEGIATGNATTGWQLNVQESGEYILRASQSNGSCKIDIPVQVNVSQIGYTPLEENYIICKDNILELSTGQEEIDISVLPSQILSSYGFDAVPVTGFTHNNLTGTTTVANSTTVFSEGTGSVRFSHSTTSTGNLTQTTGSDVSGGYGVKIEFDHIALLESAYYDWDYGYVQYSTDGGTTWTSFNQDQYLGEADLETTSQINYVRFGSNSYTEWDALSSSSTPTNAMWKHETFFLPQGDLDLSNFKIRFFLKSDFTTNWYGWMLDNVVVSKIGLPSTLWTGSHLYIDEAATQAYAGEDVKTVYFKHNVEGEYAISATVSNATNNCTATTATTVKIPTVVIPDMSNQVYCVEMAVEDLVYDKINGYTYTWHSSATSAATVTTISASGTYYLEVTSNEGGCKAPRVPVEIVIAQNLEPVVNASYTFCDQATFANINVGTQYGAAVQWFASADSTTALDPATSLTTTTYYVGLAINNCISARKPVNVTILQTPAPIAGQQAFTVCYNTSLSALNVGVTNVKWYYTQTSTTALGASAIAQSNTYYVSTFNGICESARIPVAVTVVQQLQMPTATAQSFCVNGTVSQLVATGAVSGAEYVWYASATSTTPLQPGASLQSGTYYVIQKLNGCESARRAVTVYVTNLTAPQTTSFAFCGSATVADLQMPPLSGVTYNWYLPNGSTPLASTTALTTGNYYVSKSQNGCESAKTIVQVTIKPRPTSPTGSLTQNFIDSAVLSDLEMDQMGVIWYVTYEDALNGVNPLQPNMPLEDGHTYYGVLIGSNGCASLPTAVNVVITLNVKDLDLASLKYYPNPVSSELTVTYKDPIKLIEVYDILGKQVKVQKFDATDVRLDVSSLSSGTYMLRVQTDSGSQFIKVIKN